LTGVGCSWQIRRLQIARFADFFSFAIKVDIMETVRRKICINPDNDPQAGLSSW
jgi:hypothetical protein